MNSFGTLFKVHIFGESHGSNVGVTLDGVPPGIPLTVEEMMVDLKRRQGGNQKFTTPRKEADIPLIITGLFNGFTTGAPLTILFENNNTRSTDYEKQRAFFRPGHADFVANKKYNGFEDFRGGGHFSARLTVGIVAAGVIAKKILGNISFSAAVTNVGGYEDIELGLTKALEAKDSVGGLIEGKIEHVPIGWGEPFWDSIESRLSHAFFAIPAVKGVSFGAGFNAISMMGSQHNDTFEDEYGSGTSNHAGGILGGISNGRTITFKLAIKPTASTPQPQFTFNNETKSMDYLSVKGRHDLCVALRAPVIVEAMAAIVMADFKLLAAAQNHYRDI